MEDRYRMQREDLSRRMDVSGITAPEKSALDQEMKNISARYDTDKKAYDAAVKNVEDRQKLNEKMMKERLSYLKDRNDIRMRMAENPMTSDNFDKFRGEISKLEDKRMTEERAIRDDMMKLGSAMPAAYARPMFGRGNVETRRARWDARFDRMKNTLEARWNRANTAFQDRMKSYDERLSAANLTDVERQRIQNERTALQNRVDAAQKRYQEATQKLGERRAMENQRLQAREDYMNKRTELRKNMENGTVKYTDMTKYDDQVRALDAQYEQQETQYRDRIRSLEDMIPDDAGDPNWQQEAQQQWNQGVRNANATVDDAANAAINATTGTAAPMNRNVQMTADQARTVNAAAATSTALTGNPGVNRAVAATEADAAIARERAAHYRDGEREGLLERAKDKIVETYHDAVNYLTD